MIYIQLVSSTSDVAAVILCPNSDKKVGALQPSGPNDPIVIGANMQRSVKP